MSPINHDDDKTRTIDVIAVGTVVGRYRILERIGAGGMGKVYLADDSESGRRVAVKTVDQKLVSAKLIKKEIETLSILEHDFVIRLFDAFKYHDDFCIVTEYVEGGTLYERLQSGLLDFESVQKYAHQILDALDYIHSQGIIHSDLKPHNIIIDSRDNVKVIDFGIARTASAEIAADIKQIRGTLRYMSPEQIDRKPHDIRSDLFSFGIILYEICTGSNPFKGQEDNAVMYSILYDDPIPAEKISNRVTPQLSALIMSLLAKNPADRPGSALEVRQLLAEALAATQEAISPRGNRLAILPFSYPDKDEKSRVLAQGLNEEFYSSFRGVEGLEIVSPIKIEPHVNQLVDGTAIRMLLGADYYLRGTVRRTSDRLRIYFTLFKSAEDDFICSYKFDRPLGDLFDLIDSIADTVLIELKIRLFPKTTAARGATTPSPEAYELYLLARSYYVKNTKKDVEYAREILNQALQIDPDYSLAYVGLADCHCVEYMNYFDRHEANIVSATTWAERALSIAPHLPEAYRSLGRIMREIGEPDKARSYYLRAVTYNSDYYQAYRSLGWLAVDAYHYDEAIAWVRKALSIKSTDIETILLKGLIHLDRKESNPAINDFTRCLELRPDYGRAYFHSGMAYFQLGRIGDAIANMERAIELGGDINAPYLLGTYYLAAGQYTKASEALHQAAQYPEIAFLADFYLGLTANMSGNAAAANAMYKLSYDKSAELLEKDNNLVVAKSLMCKTTAILGKRDDCLEVLDEVRHYAAFDGSFATELAHVFAIMGNREEAQKYIDLAVATVRGPSREEMANDPVLKCFLR